jgi:hypothetical protein
MVSESVLKTARVKVARSGNCFRMFFLASRREPVMAG